MTLLPSDTAARPDLAQWLRDASPGTAVYCCGPAEMLDAVQARMPTVCPQGQLHIERFAARDRTDAGPHQPFEAELRRTGIVVHIPAGATLLSALQDVDPTLTSSCEDGVCGSCEARVLDGIPDHRDDVLQPHERDRGDIIYPCVSRARGNRIVLDL